jgi:hypothetical protein
MNLRWKVGGFLAGIGALAVLWMQAPAASGGEGSADPSNRVATTLGTDWSLRIEPNGTFRIDHKGVPVIGTYNVFWGPKGWTWAAADFKLQKGNEGRPVIVGSVPGLKLQMIGVVQSSSSNRLVIDFELRASESYRDLVGGGWHWKLRLDSPSFGGRLPDPVLLENQTGWSWQTGSGQALRVRFEPSAAKVYFEKNQKTEIRTFFVADSMKAGTSRVRVTIELPEGGRRVLSAIERYGESNTSQWFRGALAWDVAPVDLSFLNREDRPAGRRGFVRADGDRLVLGDGTPARFWGANVVADALFATPRENVPRQAHRMAQLGYNLMRVHHHDSEWVNPNIFDRRQQDTRHLDAKSLDSLDWWIKCLEDEGIYVWLDMNVGRVFKPRDGITEGFDEIAKNGGFASGFAYYNKQVQALMKEFQHDFLNHLNRYTKVRYKDDPAVLGVLITNENDMSHHYGNRMLPDYKNLVHNALWDRGYKAFAAKHGLTVGRVRETWLPGPSKLYLCEVEHEFNETMIGDLKSLGVKAPIATTNFWGEDPLFSLPPLTDGDVIDVHCYGASEAMDVNAHYQGNYVSWIAGGQVYGKPLTITEWNVEYPKTDRFTSPLYMASVAALQGWDAPMLFTYSIFAFDSRLRPDTWSTFHDPAITGVVPAAALLYRQGHVSPAKTTYCLMLDPAQLFGRALTPDSSAAIRTLAERSKLTIGLPRVKELPWIKPTEPSSDATIVTDPDHDFIPEGQSFVRSDTDELTRDWEQGIQTIDTPKTQAVSGWIGGKALKTRDATFQTTTAKAVIALSSVDNRPLSTSRFIMVTAVARVLPSPGNRMPYLSEPVFARISLRNENAGLELLALGRNGLVVGRSNPERNGDVLTVDLPTGGGTHWYVLKSNEPANATKATTKGAGGPTN